MLIYWGTKILTVVEGKYKSGVGEGEEEPCDVC